MAPGRGDFVKYGTQGIFRIEDIRPMRFGRGSRLQCYYVLHPIASGKAEIFVPTANSSLVARMRPVPSAKEIDAMILSVRGQSLPWIADRRERTANYQQILARRSEPELLLLIGCLFLQSHQRTKGLTPADAQLFKEAKAIIGEEFSFSLHLPAEEVGGYIRAKLS